ncbi:hypothetical protein [Argonema galeatum]|uniref:hypothetical protein n=1 Tax=Argonema galeatum TaxID=2942762 RepID=UPI002010E7AC|nr:hypothetical protein [Argonema galeatum]MCL1467544.1 hypothetical protein [Argonema galeatum A003/A1]
MRKLIKVLANWTIPAILGGLVTLGVIQFQTRVKYLDFGIDTYNLIDSSTQKLPNDKLKIVFDNDSKNPVNKISQIKVSIYNFSDQDYENISLYIEIAPKFPSSKELKIIPTQAIAVSPENADKVAQRSRPINLKGQRYGYKIKILNRTDKIEQPAFEAIYTVIGEKAENIIVKPDLVVKSLKVREFAYENFLAKNNWWNYLLIKFPLVTLMPGVVIYWLMEVQYPRSNYIKKENNKINSLKEIFAQPGEMDKLKQQQSPSAMAEHLIGTYFVFNFENFDKNFSDYLTNNLSQPGEMDKLKQQPSPSAMADFIVNYFHQFRLKNTDQEELSYLIDKLSQPGEMDKLKQHSSPLIVADYILKTYREVAWKNIPWWEKWLSKIAEP